jgi:hypothetical protein
MQQFSRRLKLWWWRLGFTRSGSRSDPRLSKAIGRHARAAEGHAFVAVSIAKAKRYVELPAIESVVKLYMNEWLSTAGASTDC